MDNHRNSTVPSSGKFGKLLAVGMVIALLFGVGAICIGIYIINGIGPLISSVVGKVNFVTQADLTNQNGQAVVYFSNGYDENTEIGSWAEPIAIMILVLGSLVIIYSCLGIYGGLYHNKVALYATVVVLIMSSMLSLYMISIFMDENNSFSTTAKTDLVNRMTNQYKIQAKNDDFSKNMNTIMMAMQCCGVRNSGDFKNFTYVDDTDKTTIPFQIAPACCNREHFQSKASEASQNLQIYEKVVQCAKNGAAMANNINTQGCFDLVFDKISGRAMTYLLMLLIWNILVFLLTLLTIMENPPEDESALALKEEKRREELLAAQAAKKFIPYAKISSFQTQDLSRIKSTEIW